MDIINSLKNLDTQLFLFLNSKNNDFFDMVMYCVSNKFFWIPLYLFLLFLAYKKIGKRLWLLAVAAVLLILLSDQISVHAFKNIFLRERPCHDLLLQAKVHLIYGNCGGTYGFVSSHAANTFALAMFLTLFFRGRFNYFGILIFSWAALNAYSRVYGGVHYPADVVGGAIVGMGIGIAVFKLYSYSYDKIFNSK